MVYFVAKVVPFMAKGGPVLMAKGGILLVAEIGILYLTIYNFASDKTNACRLIEKSYEEQAGV